jgi:hypothetical protein
MPTIVKRKLKKPKADEHPLYNALNDLRSELDGLDALVGGVVLGAIEDGKEPDANEVAEIAERADRIATVAGPIASWLGPNPTPNAADFYSRPAGYRRLLLLEAIADLPIRIEQMTNEEFGQFASGNTFARMRNWREMPWPGAAKDEERFERHVLDLARAFTGSGEYALRR